MRNQVLGNRYRILDRIGEGGMAFVYLAVDEKLGRKVAVKVLHEHMERNPDIRKRFQMEAQAVSSLDHPNIVRIYDFSGAHDARQADEATSGRLWIVTEVIRGKNLAQFVQQFTGGWLHPVVAACIVREICKALDAAHARGIVHRDIKPENIMLTSEGRIKLMDFGIAKDMGKNSMTVTGTFMGSPSYMSPEQIRGRDVDLRSDLYSLAVLFYEIVTGRLPFTGNTTHDVVLKIVEGGYTHPRFIVPSLPDRLNAVIVRGMSKVPAQRFQSASELGREVDQFLAAAQFDESHIELERYFKDASAYMQRLSKTGFGTEPARPQTTRQHRLSQHATRARTGLKSTVAPPERDPTLRLPAPPPFRADETWQRRLHQQSSNTVQRPASATERHTRWEEPEWQRPAPQPTERHDVASAPMPPPFDKTPVAAPPPAPTRRLPMAPLPPPIERGRARPQARRPSPGGARRDLRASRSYRPTSGAYFLGVLLVGLVFVLSIWGFWELEQRLASGPGSRGGKASETSASSERPRSKRINKTKDGTPVVVKRLSRATVSPAERQRTKLNQKTVSTAKSRPALTERKAPVHDTSQRTSSKKPRASKPAELSVDSTELRQRRPEPKARTVVDASATTPKDQTSRGGARPAGDSVAVSTSQASGSKTSEPPSESKSARQGKVQVSSEPAAEIFIDGKRVGTTVDQTSHSGWISLSAGQHALVLKRHGYADYQTSFELAPAEQLSLPRISLSSGVSEAPTSSTLTLRVNQLPAQVTIKNLRSNTTQAFTMQDTEKTMTLENGRYQVRVEREGQTKERELDLSGTGELTFSADFKEE